MPFCPDCKYEYESGVHVCPDCSVDLVDELPDVKETPSDVKFVAMPNLPGRVYADMVKGVLEQKGIPCYFRSEGIIDAIGISGTGPVNRGVHIFVPEDRLEECLEIQRGMHDHI